MRYFVLDKFNTWYDWRLTLTSKDVTAPEVKTNYVSIDGMHGTLDLTEALTGDVLYNDRTVTASVWSDEGTFLERAALLKTITSSLHGKKVQIIEPDDPEHYFLGRIKIKNVVQDQVHIEFTIEATCEPWRYAVEETKRRVVVNNATVDAVINNNGVKALTPALIVTGTVHVTFNGNTTKLTEGTWKISDLRLAQGVNVIKLYGWGTVTFVYREADL